jgi:hypothetical protein
VAWARGRPGPLVICPSNAASSVSPLPDASQSPPAGARLPAPAPPMPPARPHSPAAAGQASHSEHLCRASLMIAAGTDPRNRRPWRSSGDVVRSSVTERQTTRAPRAPTAYSRRGCRVGLQARLAFTAAPRPAPAADAGSVCRRRVGPRDCRPNSKLCRLGPRLADCRTHFAIF